MSIMCHVLQMVMEFGNNKQYIVRSSIQLNCQFKFRDITMTKEITSINSHYFQLGRFVTQRTHRKYEFQVTNIGCVKIVKACMKKNSRVTQ